MISLEEQTIYRKLKEATALANVIEAAECRFVSLDDDSIRELDKSLLRLLDETRMMQVKKIS